MKPAQTACTSKAAQPGAPIAACTWAAVDGKIRSGVVVATMMRSISEASSPERPSASRAAATASDVVPSPCVGSQKRRASIPVRVRIHSSFVSMPSRSRRAASSSFVTRCAGRAAPVAMILEYMVV